MTAVTEKWMEEIFKQLLKLHLDYIVFKFVVKFHFKFKKNAIQIKILIENSMKPSMTPH